MKKAEFQALCEQSFRCWGDKYRWRKLLKSGQKIKYEGQDKIVWFTLPEIVDMMNNIEAKIKERKNAIQNRSESLGNSKPEQGKTGDD